MKCPKCQFENREGAKFCGKCRTKFSVICPQCDSENPPENSYCDECGHDLTLPSEPTPKPPLKDLSFDEKLDKIQRYLPKGLTEKILSQRDKIEGERKQVTVMFCDMEGFTQLSERLGPEEAYSIMDQIYEILIHKVHDYEGTVNEMTGDGIMALFGAPIALEDAPQRSIRSALAIHREMARFSDRIKQERKGIPSLKMRIGIHTGPVVVGTLGNDLRVEFKAVGDTVNLASRMEGLAEPGTTYVSEETFKLTEGLFRFEALGEREVKGKQEPVEVYRVIAPSTRRTRFDVSAERGLTPFVGRERELGLLLNGFERAKEGRGQAFSIMAEAGVGKSRLLYEFRKAVSYENATFLEGKCLSYSRGVAYHPVIDTLKSNFDIQESDSHSQIREKVEKGLKILRADEALTLPLLLDLLSVKDSGIDKIPMSSEARRDRIIETITRIALKGSEIRPLVMSFEDLHWIDKSSEDVIKTLLANVSGARIFLILTYRPEFVHTWGGRSYHSQVTLNRLSNQESLSMVTHLLGTDDIDSDLEELILEKTEGVPFFIEEFVRSLRDLKIIARKDNRYHLAKDIKAVTIPSTIQDVIMARVDSLPKAAKELLQTGSAVEREFSYEIIKRLMDLPEQELLSHLSVLKDSELLYERGIYPQSTFIFKHALTQEVAYESLLKKRRREIHGRVAQAIEEIYSDGLEEHYEVLAYHYGRSEKASESLKYLMLAGEKSTRQNAFRAASEFFKTALEVLERHGLELDPEAKVQLHRGLARASVNIGSVGNAAEELRKATELSRQYGMIDYELKCLRQFAMITTILPVRAEAEQILKEGLARAREVGDKALEGAMLSQMGSFSAMYGEPYAGNQMALEAERVGMESGKPRPILSARFLRASTERWIGRPEKTVELTEGMVEALRNSASLANLTALIFMRGVALAEIGRIEDAVALLTEGIDISEKFGVPLRLATFYNCLGYCYSEIHHHETAWRLNLKGKATARELMEKYPMSRRLYAEILAQANVNMMENLFDQGKIEEAWNLIQSFEEESKSEDYDLLRHQWESRMNYLAAQILLSRDNIDQAKLLIHQNLKKIREQHARKREGGFLRMLGEVQIRCNESENAIENFNEAILILKEVGNPRQLWQAYASLASAFSKLGRSSEAQEQGDAAAEVIRSLANGLSDRELREGFLAADPIQEILSKAQS
jgi:class 3 adenylate cyclase/tetratricopeptide (TPR) repeat protein